MPSMRSISFLTSVGGQSMVAGFTLGLTIASFTYIELTVNELQAVEKLYTRFFLIQG